MKNWIAEQGWGLYIMIGMAIVGVIGSIVCRVFYGRLAREAQVCGTSDYPLLHYIRQKYTSYYKLITAQDRITAVECLPLDPCSDDRRHFAEWSCCWSLSLSAGL